MSDEEEIIQPKGRVAPDNLGTSILLSAGYDGALQKAYLRLYEPESQEIYLWYDNTGHLPYLISKQSVEELQGNRRVVGHDGFKSLEKVKKYDALADKEIDVTKVVAKDPLSVGGGPGCIRSYLDESWESRIRYYGCYIFDMHLVPGMPYKVVNGDLVQGDWSLPTSVEAQFNEILSHTEDHLKEPMRDWARLLQSPVPNIRRVAVDIEVRASVKNRVPSPDEAKDPITAVAFAGSNGLRKILLLNDSGLPVDTPQIAGADEVTVYESEREIIQETFRVLDQYPVVLTFNGDDFDFKYLRNRARNLGVPDDENPITLGRRFAFLTNGVHIDLYQFFRNRSIQG
jgi:DNA polymerase I